MTLDINVAAERRRGEEATVVGEPTGSEHITRIDSAAEVYRRRKQELIKLTSASPSDSDELQRVLELCEQARLAVKQAIRI